MLGVSAARETLMREIEEMVASGSTYVDRHHIALMADTMFSTGTYRGFTHSGMKLLRDDVLLHASYERQSATMQHAALNGAIVDVKSPAAAVCVGTMVPGIGTSAFDVLLDREALQRNEIVFDPQEYIARAAHDDEQQRRTAYFDSDQYAASPSHNDVSFAVSPSSNGFAASDDDDVVAAAAFSPVNGFASFLDQATSATQYSPTSSLAASSSSPLYYSPTSPAACYSPTSPTAMPFYSPTSPSAACYSPTSPLTGFSSPMYSPTSPAYSPTAYSPTSPTYSPTTTFAD